MKKICFLLLFFCLLHPIYSQSPLNQFGSDVFVTNAGYPNLVHAISGDGQTVVIGPLLSLNSSGIGAVKIFIYNSGNWVQSGGDILGETAGEEFGSKVSISDDGLTVAIGAWKRTTDSLGWGTGYVKVYTFVSGNWIQKGQSLFGYNVNGEFGKEIWLSGNGDTMVVRAQSTVPPQNQYLKIFNFSSGNWNLSSTFEPVPGTTAFYIDYQKVDLSSNGTRLAVGATIWDLISNQWVRTDNNFYNSYEGVSSVSLSGDGNSIAIGNNNGFFVYKNYSGSNWQYSYGENLFGYSDKIVNINFGGNVVAVWHNDDQSVKTYQFINDLWTYFGYLPNANPFFNLSSGGYKIITYSSVYSNNPNYNTQTTVKVYDTSSLLGSENFNTFNFTIFPNPAKNEINIKLKDNSILEKINLYNLLGQKICETNNSLINISGYEKGNYLLEVITNNGRSTKREIFE